MGIGEGQCHDLSFRITFRDVYHRPAVQRAPLLVLPEDVLRGTDLNAVQMGRSHNQPITTDVPQDPRWGLQIPEGSGTPVVNIVRTKQATGIASEQVA